jgi:hypothetical protein
MVGVDTTEGTFRGLDARYVLKCNKRMLNNHGIQGRLVPESALLVLALILLSQQWTFWAYGPSLSRTSGSTIVNTVATWEWQLTLVFGVSLGVLLAAKCFFPRRLVLVAYGWLVLYSAFYLWAQTFSVLGGVSIFGYTRDEIRGVHSFDVQMPALWWHTNGIVRQIIMDPSYIVVWCLTLATMVLGAKAWLAYRIRKTRRAHGCCEVCGYDLRGLEHDVCPECGAGGFPGMSR